MRIYCKMLLAGMNYETIRCKIHLVRLDKFCRLMLSAIILNEIVVALSFRECVLMKQQMWDCTRDLVAISIFAIHWPSKPLSLGSNTLY